MSTQTYITAYGGFTHHRYICAHVAATGRREWTSRDSAAAQLNPLTFRREPAGMDEQTPL